MTAILMYSLNIMNTGLLILIFADFLKGDINFNLFFYQRMFLRIDCAYRYVLATFTRVFEIVFMILVLYLVACSCPEVRCLFAQVSKNRPLRLREKNP